MALSKTRPKRSRPHKPPTTLSTTKTTAESAETQSGSDQYEPETIDHINVLMDRLTKAISHLDFHESPKLHLLGLPQEIQDIIFDFAYPTVDGFKVITKAKLNERELEERRDRGSSYTRRPFTTPIVSSFMISKKFFISAASAFVGNQTLDLDHSITLLRSPEYMLIARFLRKAILDLVDFASLLVSESFPQTLKYITAHEEEFNDSDLRAIAKYFQVDRISGFREFQLVAAKNYYPRSQEEQHRWTCNIRILEAYIQSRVTTPNPRTTVTNLRNAAALYPGSLVYAAGSREVEEEATDPGNKPKQEPSTDIELRDLPNNIEDFKALLDRDGDQVMDLIATLKMSERIRGSIM